MVLDVPAITPKKAGVKGRRKKTEEDRIPLPDPFPLPEHYPYNIEVALKNKQMTKTTKGKFLTEVASAMFRYKYFPTHDDYVNVARCIVTKYPFMKPTDLEPYVSLYKYTCTA